jgi:hypothetical protein
MREANSVMPSNRTDEITTADIKGSLWRLAAFESALDIFAKSGPAHQPSTQSEMRDGYYCFDPGRPSAIEIQFLELAYQDGWVVAGFDWPSWIRTERGQVLLGQPAAVAQATELELFQLITTLVRQERFAEGSLAEAFRRGLVSALIERAKVLCALEHCSQSTK